MTGSTLTLVMMLFALGSLVAMAPHPLDDPKGKRERVGSTGEVAEGLHTRWKTNNVTNTDDRPLDAPAPVREVAGFREHNAKASGQRR
jgi:hypothetical protein